LGEVVMLMMFNTAVPELVRVTLWAALAVPTSWLEKLRLDGDTVNAGAGRPVPANAIVWGLLAAPSVTVTVPYRLPTAVGLNVTLIVQLAPAPRLAPQVLLSAKSPVAVRLVIATAVLPVLVRVAL
jgi:hypothetical protein